MGAVGVEGLAVSVIGHFFIPFAMPYTLAGSLVGWGMQWGVERSP